MKQRTMYIPPAPIIPHREIAMKWWLQLSPDEQKVHLKYCAEFIVGGSDRKPEDLTGREIEFIYMKKVI
jgi:hypothetical protein